MVHNIFKGLGIALITPFKEDGAVDYDAILRLLDYQLKNGADFFCILATTGETPTLTAEEKLKIKNLIVDRVQGRVPILMGCGGNNTAAVVEELKKMFPEKEVVRVDERFTSKIAFQTMIDSGLKKKDRRNKGTIDQIAATIMLQDYMRTINNKTHI